MPRGYETETGYWDMAGVFHSNTGLIPSIIPGVSTTTPIIPGQGYDWLPVYTAYTPLDYFIDQSQVAYNRAYSGAEQVIDTASGLSKTLSYAIPIGILALLYVGMKK